MKSRFNNPTSPPNRSEAAKFRAEFGDRGAVWYAEGLTFEQAGQRDRTELRQQNESLKKQLEAYKLAGEGVPVSFNAVEENKRSAMQHWED